MVDKTRYYDLEELQSAIDSTSVRAKKEHLQKIMDKILSEAHLANAERENLVRAVKYGATDAAKYYTEKIKRIMREHYGRDTS